MSEATSVPPGAPASPGGHSFIEEFRRRKVHRVAAVYVAVGIGVLEAADLLSPVLLLPEWAYRLVAWLVLVGFPIAVAVSWTFDLTRGGVERTPPPQPGSHEPASHRPPTRRTRLVLGTTVVAVAVMGTLGWRVATPQAVTLDERTVVVLPFRVSGGPSLDYLSEGMMDLLVAQLPGDVGPRALDPPSVIARLTEGDAPDALSRRDAVELARGLGASAVLQGSVVGTPERIVVDAGLLDAASGRQVARIQADAPETELPALINRLTLSLLAQAAEAQPYLASQLTDSLEALRAYLRGQSLSRRGLYFPSMDALEQAIEIDSTFAKAAIAFRFVACWTFECSGERASRAHRLAWASRSRLGVYDRLKLEIGGDPSGPGSTRRERLAGWQRLVEMRPEDGDAWSRLAWTVFQHGAMLGMEDTEAIAGEHMRRALGLGSELGAFALNAGMVFFFAGDTAGVVEVTERFLRGQPEGAAADWARWWLAHATGDGATAQTLLSRIPSMTPETVTRFMRFASLSGQGIEAGDSAAAEMDRRIRRSAAPDLGVGPIELQIYLANRGWPSRARETRDAWAGNRADVVVTGWLWAGYGDSELDRAVQTLADEGWAEAQPGGADPFVQSLDRCLVSFVRMRRDGVGPTGESLERAPDQADPDHPVARYWARTASMCTALLEAWQAVEEGRPDAADLVAVADSIQLQGEDMYVPVLFAAPIELARLKERLDDLPGALSTIRRQQRGGFVVLFSATRVREEGRLAALNGDVEGAIRAYEHYLALRSDPEPEVAEEVTRVREEYEQLLAVR